MPNFLINVKEKGAKKASKNIGGLNTALGGLAGKAALAAGAFFGGGMLLSGMRNAITLAGEQEKAEKTLEVALGKRSQALLNQAKSLQQVTTFGDEAIISAQALIGAFVNDEEQIKLATAATLDLAAAKGMDLTVAADLVSKTLGSSTNAMSRYGIQVTGAVGSTERLESLTNNLANVFGGQATAQAQTMAGSIEQAKNAMGDAAETMGNLLAPTVIKVAKFFKGAAEAVDLYLFSLKNLDDESIQQLDSQEKIAIAISKTEEELFNLKRTSSARAKATSDESDKVKILEDRLTLLNNKYNENNILITQSSEVMGVYKFAIDPAVTSLNEFNRGQTDYLGNLKKVEVQQMTTMSQMEQMKVFIDANKDSLKLQGKQFLSNVGTMGKAFPEMEKAAKKAAQVQALVDAYASANAAYKAMAGIPVVGPALGIAAATAAVGAGLANVKMIEQAEEGGLIGGKRHSQGGTIIEAEQGEFIMKRSAVNRIGVNDLNNMNQGGGGGASVTVNVSGNVMSQDYVEGELAEQIKEAIRRGNDFGVS